MSSSDLPFEPLLDREEESPRAWEPLWELPAGAAGPQAEDVGPREAPAEAGEAASSEASTAELERRAFAAGYELGREEMHAQVESVAESFVKSLEELAAFRARLRDRYERELLELALGVARKVVHRDVQERPETWLAMIREAVRQAVDRERIRIRVPGSLACFLRERLPELRAQLDEVREIELVEDPGLRAGGCVIETHYGDLHLGVDTQIDEIERQLVRVEVPGRAAGSLGRPAEGPEGAGRAVGDEGAGKPAGPGAEEGDRPPQEVERS